MITLIVVLFCTALAENVESADGFVLIDEAGIKVTFNNECAVETNYDGSAYLVIKAIYENNSDKAAGISINEAYVNGWKAYCDSIGAIAPGKKAKAEVRIALGDTDASTIEDIKEIEFSGWVYDDNNYDKIADLGLVVWQFTK